MFDNCYMSLLLTQLCPFLLQLFRSKHINKLQNTTSLTPLLFTDVIVPSQESEWSYMCLRGIDSQLSIFGLPMVSILG